MIFVAAMDRKLLLRPYAIRFKKSGTKVRPEAVFLLKILAGSGSDVAGADPHSQSWQDIRNFLSLGSNSI